MGAMQLPALFRDQFQIATTGDAYLIPCAAESLSAVRSGLHFVRRQPGEIPILGARRVENILARANSTAAGFPAWDPRAWTSQTASGGAWSVEGGYPGPTGKPNGAVRVWRTADGFSKYLYTEIPSVVSSVFATRIFAFWARSLTGSPTPISITTDQSGVGAVVGTEWTRVAGRAVSGWAARLGIIGRDVHSVNMLISIEEGYRAQYELHQGSYYPNRLAPCEPVDPAVDYSLIDGCGGLGIRYFDTYNGNAVNASGQVTEGEGSAIPDIMGVLPRPSVTNRIAANNPVLTAASGVDVVANGSLFCGDLAATRYSFSGTPGLEYFRRPAWTITPSSGLQWGFSAIARAEGPTTHLLVYARYSYPTSGAVDQATWLPITGSSPTYYEAGAHQYACSVEPIGNGWWWLKAMGQVASGTAFATIGLMGNAGGTGVNQTTTTAVLVAGVTLHEGGLYPPIPMISQSASAVSVADALTINSLACGSRFTIFAEVYMPPEGARVPINGISQRLIADGNGNGLPALYVPFDQGGIAWHTAGIGIGGAPALQPGVNRVAITHDLGYVALWLNGVAVASMMAASSGMVARGLGQSGGARHGNVCLRDVRIWPGFAAHAELAAALTASGSVL